MSDPQDEHYGHDTDELVRQFAVVRDTGATNVVSRAGVQDVARQLGHDELVDFINRASAAEYVELLERMEQNDPLRGEDG